MSERLLELPRLHEQLLQSWSRILLLVPWQVNIFTLKCHFHVLTFVNLDLQRHLSTYLPEMSFRHWKHYQRSLPITFWSCTNSTVFKRKPSIFQKSSTRSYFGWINWYLCSCDLHGFFHWCLDSIWTQASNFNGWPNDPVLPM